MYPNEYATNLNCQLELQSEANTSLQIEMLEFDLEAADEGTVGQANSVEDAIRQLNSNRTSMSKLDATACQRDYLAIGASQHTRLCGTLSPFTTILNVASNVSTDAHQYVKTGFKFYSDDALTRRGFWLKLKG